jgi:hypothetical protein
MMQRSLWLEFRQKWPEGYWDDWMREPVNSNIDIFCKIFDSSNLILRSKGKIELAYALKVRFVIINKN